VLDCRRYWSRRHPTTPRCLNSQQSFWAAWRNQVPSAGNQPENEEIFKELLNADAVKLLFEILKNGDQKLKECVARTLKSIFRHSKAPRHVVFHPPFLALFTSLMESSHLGSSLLHSVASILAASCDSEEKQMSLLSDALLDSITSMLSSSVSKA
jgi:hypothetical protein